MIGNIDVGIVGCGQVSDNHITAWRNVGANIVAVCDSNVSAARSKAEKWNISRYYGNVEEMIEKQKLTAVSVCTPAHVRLSVVKPLLEAGIHVVNEKPFAVSVSEAEAMVELKKKYGVKLSVVHNWLFSYAMKKTLQYLNRRELGDVIGMEIDLLHTKDDQMTADPRHWCHRMEAGRFGEMLPHPIYLILAVLGDMDVEHIYGSKIGGYEWMPIDELHILFRDLCGRMASVYISFNSARQEQTLKVFGTKCLLEVDLLNHILIKKQPRYPSRKEVAIDNLKLLGNHITSYLKVISYILTRQWRDPHTEFMKTFLDSIINNKEPPVTAEEALKAVHLHTKLCSLVHKSYFNTFT